MKIYLYRNGMLLSIFVFALFSCSKQKFAANDQLNGTWKWISTDGGIGYNIHRTPSSTGKNIDLEFTGDNNYLIFTNGTITSQGQYTLEQRNCIHDHTDKKFINFSNADDNDMVIETMDGNILNLSDEAYDGVNSLYSRK